MWLCDEKAQGKRLADRTVRTNLAPVQALLATAVEEGIIRSNPALGVRLARRDGVSRPSTDERELRKALSREELARLLGAIDEHWRLFFELLAHTGLRIGEAVELRWSDIDFGSTPTVHVRRQFFQGEVGVPKTRHGVRAIPLSTGMARALWQRQGAPAELVFMTMRGTRVQRDNLWRRVLKPAAREAGVEWVGFHTFRHTCASLLFGAGKNVKQVQEWLGHHDPGFTLRTYVHLVDGGLGDADFLDDLVGARVATLPPTVESAAATA
jgi:integrase